MAKKNYEKGRTDMNKVKKEIEKLRLRDRTNLTYYQTMALEQKIRDLNARVSQLQRSQGAEAKLNIRFMNLSDQSRIVMDNVNKMVKPRKKR